MKPLFYYAAIAMAVFAGVIKPVFKTGPICLWAGQPLNLLTHAVVDSEKYFLKFKSNIMKIFFVFAMSTIIPFVSYNLAAQSNSPESTSTRNEATIKTTDKSLFIDVHNLEPGKITFADVMAAHQKDLATEGKYDVNFIKFWVDEQKGKVYCLSSAKDSTSVIQTHAEAHGLLPSAIYKVTAGSESTAIDGKQFFLDVHNLGAGNVTAAAVAEAHKKDLAVEKKYRVNFINYWVDEKNGTVFCLSEAPDSNAVIKTHKEAHGLLPAYVLQVKQGE